MPIGKSAIKRITNNGYSHVESKAPDMENSTVAEMPLVPVKHKRETPAPKKSTKAKAQTVASPKHSTTQKEEQTPVKRSPGRPRKNPVEVADTQKMPVKKPSAKKKNKDTVTVTLTPPTAENQQITESAPTERDGFCYVNLGGELPVHLL